MNEATVNNLTCPNTIEEKALSVSKKVRAIHRNRGIDTFEDYTWLAFSF